MDGLFLCLWDLCVFVSCTRVAVPEPNSSSAFGLLDAYQFWGVLKHRLLPLLPSPQVSDIVSLRWGPRVCISNTFPDAAVVANPGTTYREPLV